MRKFNVAVVGATGAVGEEVFRVMEELNFPVNKVIPLASARSAGSTIEFLNKDITVLELTETVFEEQEVEIAFFCAGGSISEKFAKFAVEAGAVVIDNTSHFRMDPKVPLVVPALIQMILVFGERLELLQIQIVQQFKWFKA
jgi:aspartate-semialdehyde dehydrogenase